MRYNEGVASVLLLFAILIGAVIVAGCDPQQPMHHPNPKFMVGQTVTIGQTSEKVVVVDRWYRGDHACWTYECRVASPIQQDNGGLFSRDTDITRYALVWFREFELKE